MFNERTLPEALLFARKVQTALLPRHRVNGYRIRVRRWPGTARNWPAPAGLESLVEPGRSDALIGWRGRGRRVESSSALFTALG
jgi:hypothetical protein